jgi:hypothetical protein
MSVFAQNTKNETDKNKYQKIEIAKFDLKDGVEKLTDSSLEVMMSEIVDELKKLNKFKEVTIEPTKPKDAAATDEANADTPQVEAESKPLESTIRLVGTVTEYKEGNRTARYLVGFGAGRAKIKAHIKILDSKGLTLLEKDVDGNLVIGFFGGDSKSITRGLAKEVAKVTEKKFF